MTPAPPELPEVGTRISLRYLAPPGSEKPMADVVGHLLETGPRVRVRSTDGELHELRLSDVLYVRRLTDRPVKNSAIRAVEHAAALAWPGTEHHWLDGWLLRAGGGATMRANSAVPLDMFAHPSTIPAIVDWYGQRRLVPRLAVPERLLRLPEHLAVDCETRTLVTDLGPGDGPGSSHPPDRGVTLACRPDADWLACYGRAVPVEVLTAVADPGQLVFASIPQVAVGRGAVTESADGTRWLGLSALWVAADRRGLGHGRAVCAALTAWGRDRGATRGYVQVRSDAAGAFGFFASLGFTGQHRSRYLDARVLT